MWAPPESRDRLSMGSEERLGSRGTRADKGRRALKGRLDLLETLGPAACRARMACLDSQVWIQ